jgi:hypothetical protein
MGFAALSPSYAPRQKGVRMTDSPPPRPPHSPWPIEELVRAQRMACDGASLDAIAEALGRPVPEVRRKLDPDQAAKREEYASVGHPHLKGRRGGDHP